MPYASMNQFFLKVLFFMCVCTDVVTEELCKGIADGLYVVPGHCHLYTQCTNGTTRNLRCPAQTYFNPSRAACTLIGRTGATPACTVAGS